MKADRIPIFFTFDNNYVVPASVAFFSLLSKAQKGIYYEMYVLHADISEENQNLLINVTRKQNNAKLTFINTHGFLNQEWSNGSFAFQHSNSSFTADCLLRCFAARFFPGLKKIIYSDVDVIFTDDISDLYDIDLTGKYIAGVKNAFTRYSEYELSHLKEEHYNMLHDKYISGGIWVMNLEKIREDNLEDKMLDIVRDNTIVKRWNDQDIVNIACEGKVGFIPLNYISYPYMLDLLQEKDFTSDYTRNELYDSILNPKIIHFAANKPWDSNPQFSNLWWAYFNFLELPYTKIFREIPSEKKKLKRYRQVIKTQAVLLVFVLSILLWVIYTQ